MNLKKILIPVAILAIGFASMRFFSSFDSTPPRREAPPQTKLVNIDVVTPQPVRARIEVFGRLLSSQPVVLTSEVNGTLEPGNVPFKPGQSFRKGNLLLKIDERQARLDLNSAKSDFLNALANVLPEIRVDFPADYAKWEAYFDATRFEESVADLPETENRQIKLFLTRFNVHKLFFSVRNLEILLSKHAFYAPFNGTVLSAALRPGSTARAGTRLGEILNLDILEVELPLPTGDLRWLDRDADVRLTSSELDGEWTGKITRIGRAVDSGTETIPVYVSVTGGDRSRLFHGVFMRANLPGRIVPDAVEVPPGAIYENRYVYLLKNGRLQTKPVSVARIEDASVLLSGGLESGDSLVVDPLQGVAPGMLARPFTRTAANGGN